LRARVRRVTCALEGASCGLKGRHTRTVEDLGTQIIAHAIHQPLVEQQLTHRAVEQSGRVAY
jgi:hypothetical protein